MTITPGGVPSPVYRRVQEAVEAALKRKISVGINPLVIWAAAGEVVDEILSPPVSADVDHLIRQARLAPGSKHKARLPGE